MGTTATTTRELQALHGCYDALVIDAIHEAAGNGDGITELKRNYRQAGPEGLGLYWNDGHIEARHLTAWTAFLSSPLRTALVEQAERYGLQNLGISANDCRWLAGCVVGGRLVLMNNSEAEDFRTCADLELIEA